MRILVTGHTGFVGQHLVRELQLYGHDVTGVDRIEALLGAGRFEEWVDFQFRGANKPEYVVHLAARYGRILSEQDPTGAVKDNAAGTVDVAKYCARQGIPLLYASSSEVYGDHGHKQITERSKLKLPTTIYGLSKRWGEEAIQLYLKRDIPYTIVRMNMLYGPGQQWGHGRCALANFVNWAATGHPISVHAGAFRAWLFVADAVEAIRLLIETAKEGVYNLGSDAPLISMSNLARTVVRISKSRPELIKEHVKAPSDQILKKNYSSEKLYKALDWTPSMPLEDGIERTVIWQREERMRS